MAWYTDNAEGKTHPVGSKKPNELGIYDMSGNICEWCWDWYGGNYYSSSPSQNPTGPDRGRSRVRRGGYNYCFVGDVRSTRRLTYSADSRKDDFGFRLCRTAEEIKN